MGKLSNWRDTARQFVTRVFKLDDWAVSAIQAGLVDGGFWALAKIAGLTIATNPLFWVVLALLLFVVLGALQSSRGKQPDVRGKIEILSGFLSDEGRKNYLFAYVRVTNRQAPTSLSRWHLEIQFSSGDDWHRLPTGLPNETITVTTPGGKATEYEPDDHLSNKSIEPLTTGKTIYGFIVSLTDGFSLEKLKSGKIRLVCMDA